ncbi:MAG: heme-binding protein, partial [Myxococcales bacterium]|nr:heme-binding protein [Myxococcales bacterium]
MAYEEPAYTVVEEFEDFEIREYAPQLVAETTVEGDFDDAGSQAFRILFDYISGENRSSSEIAMT